MVDHGTEIFFLTVNSGPGPGAERGSARAKEIAENGPGTQTRKKVAKPDEVDLQQMSIFDTVNEDDIIKEIMELEVNRMSPLDALNTLDKLQAKLKNRWMHQ